MYQAGTPVQPSSRRPVALFWGRNEGNDALAASVEAERQATSRTAGTKFRALIRYGNGLTTETLTLKPIHPLQVVIRTEAVQTCYTSAVQFNTANPQVNAVQVGHGGIGIVEDVGRLVKRVKVGDRVIISATPNCGVCGNCLSGRGDICNTRLPALVSATMADNTPVFMTGPPMGPGGFAELLVSDEDWVVPVFTNAPPVELSMLACPGAVGLGLALCRFPVEAGTDVAVFGLGPLGISAVQGARLQGAKIIVGIDPIAYRRELALKLGATYVLDPNAVKGDDLVNRIRELTPDVAPAGRRYLGERQGGPQYGFEACGSRLAPVASGVENPPDPTGADVLQQLDTVVRNGGYVKPVGVFTQGSLTFTAGQWAASSKIHAGGNFPGVQMVRDVPRFVQLLERGRYDAKSLVGRVFRQDRMKDALEAAANRSTISTVVDFT